MDEAEFVFSSVPKPLIPRYEDVPATENLRVYSLAEIIAEKLRCVMQRLQCRDLFDLHYLLEVEGTDQDDAWEMLEQKARHKNIDLPTSLSVSMSESRSTKNGGRTRWASTLEETYRTSRPYVVS